MRSSTSLEASYYAAYVFLSVLFGAMKNMIYARP